MLGKVAKLVAVALIVLKLHILKVGAGLERSPPPVRIGLTVITMLWSLVWFGFVNVFFFKMVVVICFLITTLTAYFQMQVVMRFLVTVSYAALTSRLRSSIREVVFLRKPVATTTCL